MKPIDESAESTSIIADSIESFSFGQSPVKPTSTVPVQSTVQQQQQQQLNNRSMNIPEITSQSLQHSNTNDNMNLSIPEIPLENINNNNESMRSGSSKIIDNINAVMNNSKIEQQQQYKREIEELKLQYKNNETKLIDENNKLKQNIRELQQELDIKNVYIYIYIYFSNIKFQITHFPRSINHSSS